MPIVDADLVFHYDILAKIKQNNSISDVQHECGLTYTWPIAT